MSISITAPAQGLNTITFVGPTRLEFKDSVAEVEDLPEGVRTYLLGQGFRVGGDEGTVVESLDGAPVPPATTVDARSFDTPTQVGSKLRDAAVDPRPEDFLPPVNAGQADPHGPEVVSPEIHASQGVRPVKPGDVHVDDVEQQDVEETEHAENATDGTPIVEVAEPAGNASTDAWREYALAKGATDADVEGKSRDDLRDAYGTKSAG